MDTVFACVATQFESRPQLPFRLDDQPARMRELAIACHQLAELNYRYLSLIASERTLPDATLAQLFELLPSARRALAACPFSLFTLLFDQPGAWLPLCARVRDAPPNSSAVGSPRDEWLATAVFFGWYLSQTQPLAARILLGMDSRVAVALRDVPIVALTLLAADARDWLAPRWPQHPHFWPNLLRGSPGDWMTRSQLLGRQLLAIEALQSQGGGPRSSLGRVKRSRMSARSGAIGSLSLKGEGWGEGDR